jgi:DNA-directed RNA polymerase subunit beta'
VRVRIAGELLETTIGRLIMREVVPEEVPFKTINKVMDKKELANLIDYTYRACGNKKTVILADQLRTLGYKYATAAGISICLDDIRHDHPVEQAAPAGRRQAPGDGNRAAVPRRAHHGR